VTTDGSEPREIGATVAHLTANFKVDGETMEKAYAAWPAGLEGVPAPASLTIPGRPEHVSAARHFVLESLCGHPATSIAVLLASELVTNSVRHSDSRAPGGTVTITVTTSGGDALVEVADAGGATAPALRPAPGDALLEYGRGLSLVDACASVWGFHRERAGASVTWFACAPLFP
jgi:anti-sigma regulatory factor (Ser/Thr protein kinase)